MKNVENHEKLHIISIGPFLIIHLVENAKNFVLKQKLQKFEGYSEKYIILSLEFTPFGTNLASNIYW